MLDHEINNVLLKVVISNTMIRKRAHLKSLDNYNALACLAKSRKLRKLAVKM